MKIRVSDRVILFILATCALVVGIVGALRLFGIDLVAMLAPYIQIQLTDTIRLAIRIAAIVILVLLSLYFYSVAFRRKKKPDPFITMESGSKGNIRMSMESISSLVLQTCGKMPGISGLKVATVNHEDSVSVDMAFQVEMSKNIPELSAHIQQMVGEVVEKNCGVAVRNVTVTVSGFMPPKQEHPALPSSRSEKKNEKKGFFHRNKKEKPIPTTAEPVSEPEPVHEPEPIHEELKAEPVFVPAQEAPAVQEPQPVNEEPAFEQAEPETAYEAEAAEAPVYEEPAYEEPVYETPASEASAQSVDAEPEYEDDILEEAAYSASAEEPELDDEDRE